MLPRQPRLLNSTFHLLHRETSYRKSAPFTFSSRSDAQNVNDSRSPQPESDEMELRREFRDDCSKCFDLLKTNPGRASSLSSSLFFSPSLLPPPPPLSLSPSLSLVSKEKKSKARRRSNHLRLLRVELSSLRFCCSRCKEGRGTI